MKQVFVCDSCVIDHKLHLDSEQAHHLFDVLRIQKKEVVKVVNKEGQAFLARPLEKPYLYIFDKIEVENELRHTTLCVALIKQDKFELILQKACELGVTKIVPFESRFTIVRMDEDKKAKRMKRWEKIIFDACKQCNRNDLVQIEPIQSVETLHNYQEKCNLVLYEKKNVRSLSMPEALKQYPESVSIVVGPEGGFDINEIEILEDDHFQLVTLGSRILRAETACFYALSCIDYQNQIKKEES